MRKIFTLSIHSTTLQIFDHSIVVGDPHSALSRPYSIIINQTLANSLFGTENPIGKVLQGMRNEPYTVTAVFADLPRTSHFKYTALISASTIREQVGDEDYNDRSSGSFWNVNVYSYLLFRESASPESVLENFDSFNEKYIVPVGKAINGTFSPIFQPLTQTHFPDYEGLQADFPVGNKSNLYIFSVVSFFILVIACINYMNMATARSANRAKEVGIRKVVGAGKGRLIQQFISESMLIAFIAGLLAYVASAALLPLFNQFIDKEIATLELFGPTYILGTLLIIILVGLVSGSYPAMFLSSFSPVKVLKGSIIKGKGKVGLRKVLVIMQFTISVTMIVATIVVTQQQNFIRNKDVGFDKNNLLVINDLDTVVSNHINSFKEELLRNTSILGVSSSQQALGVGNGKIVSRIEQNGEMQEVGINLIGCDFDYLQLLGVELDEGRFFDTKFGTDSTKAFLVNQTAERVYGWSDESLGKRIQLGLRMDGSAFRDGKVVGVIKDFHYSSIHNPIEPFMFFVSTRTPNVLSIRFKDGQADEVVSYVKEKFRQFNSTREISYYFLDQRLDQLYRSEQKLGRLFRVFSLITIFISCLGLLGLTSFVTEQKTKEIGVRKVLGGTSLDIVKLLSGQFLGLVLLANIFAWPIAFYAMQKWLQSFAYRIKFGQTILSFDTISPLLLASTIALVIAMLTVGMLAWRAAESNPAQSLKYE